MSIGHRVTSFFLSLCLVFGTLGCTSCTPKPVQGVYQAPNTSQQLKERVVSIGCDSDQGITFRGTGFPIAPYLVATCAHVVDDDTKCYKVGTNEATVVWFDAQSDIAVLKVATTIGFKTPFEVVDGPGSPPWCTAGYPDGKLTYCPLDLHGNMIGADTIGGASGSPVFDSLHRVVGLVAACQPTMDSMRAGKPCGPGMLVPSWPLVRAFESYRTNNKWPASVH